MPRSDRTERRTVTQRLLAWVIRWAYLVHGQGVRALHVELLDGSEVTLKPGPGLFDPRRPPQGRQERRSPPPGPAATADGDRAAQAGWRAGIGFRSVRVGDRLFAFTEQQSRAVALLWQEYMAGTPDVPDKELIRVAEAETTVLNNVFRNCPAWGTWIVEGGSRGTHRLSAPQTGQADTDAVR